MPTTQESPTTSPIGRDTPRVDGPQKVTGVAQYTSDFHFPGMLYAVPVEATIANGRVIKLDTAAAEKMPGVRAIFHRENIGKISRSTLGQGFDGICEERRPPFEDDVVRYYGQYIALAVADTFETAKAAADAVRATYAKDKPNVDDRPQSGRRARRGCHHVRHRATDWTASAATPRPRSRPRRSSSTRPMSRLPRRTTLWSCTRRPPIWEGSTLTLYESSQGVVNLRSVLAQMFGLPNENVRVITKFVGSGFGSKLWPWTQCPLAAAAARQLGKPVKLVVSRKMMFQSVGHRPRTQQRVRLGATPDGKLVSLQHDYVYQRSMLDAHHEDCGEATPFQYSVPNLRVTFGRAKRNIGAAADMRGPGAVPGLYATESAMNELADQLKIDPVKLRVINEPKIDESLGIPFSSRHLLECFELGAEKFGWSKRTPEVGSMKRDGLTLGWGMAGCSWLAARFAAEASVQLRDDGTARVACATQDIGTGTYTILAQLASQKTGVPLDKVEVALGDTSLPAGPLSGGSMATGSVVPAVFAAADSAIASLLTVATTTPGSPFEKRKPDDLAFEGGRVFVKADGAGQGRAVRRCAPPRQPAPGHRQRQVRSDVRQSQAEVLDALVRLSLRRGHLAAGDRSAARQPGGDGHRCGAHPQPAGRPQPDRGRGRDGHRHGAVRAHVVRPAERRADQQQSGRLRVAVNADVPPIDVHFLDFPDKEINELGARGIGEIGLAGIAAAITAAVHHATGVRVRELPVKIENLLVR